MAEELNMNVTTCALNGGEDYELLFTVPIGDHEKIMEMEDVHLIGHITKESLGHVLVTRDNQEFELKAPGSAGTRRGAWQMHSSPLLVQPSGLSVWLNQPSQPPVLAAQGPDAGLCPTQPPPTGADTVGAQ